MEFLYGKALWPQERSDYIVLFRLVILTSDESNDYSLNTKFLTWVSKMGLIVAINCEIKRDFVWPMNDEIQYLFPVIHFCIN